MIDKLKKQHAAQVADLHISGIPTGFISSLGRGFVTALYEAIYADENSFGFVALDDSGEVVGFVAFSSNLGSLYKHVALKNFFKFGFILAKKMISLKVVKRVIDNIFYPAKMREMNLPDAELLSIVIGESGRGKGLATELSRAGFKECRARGIDKVKVLVAAENEPANKLYQKVGFIFAQEIDSHGVKSNVYVKDISEA